MFAMIVVISGHLQSQAVCISSNAEKGSYYLTTAHGIVDNKPITVNGVTVKCIKIDRQSDLALLWTRKTYAGKAYPISIANIGPVKDEKFMPPGSSGRPALDGEGNIIALCSTSVVPIGTIYIGANQIRGFLGLN